MNTAAATPMTKERAAGILYILVLHLLKKQMKDDGPITAKGKEGFIREMKEDAPVIDITEDEMSSFVNFVCDDLERSCT